VDSGGVICNVTAGLELEIGLGPRLIQDNDNHIGEKLGINDICEGSFEEKAALFD